MSILNSPKKIVLSIVDKVSPSCGRSLRNVAQQPAENEETRHRLEQLQSELQEIRKMVDTLNHDLDESRRLNLRAAELMDVAFNELAK